MQNLKKNSEVYQLIQQLKEEVFFCPLAFPDGVEARNALEKLEQIFEPYEKCYRLTLEEEKLREKEAQKLCAKEGHVGEWKENLIDLQFNWALQPDEYTPLSKKQWSRKCTRCGAEEVTEIEPKEVTRAKKEKEIQELEERIRKLKSEL